MSGERDAVEMARRRRQSACMRRALAEDAMDHKPPPSDLDPRPVGVQLAELRAERDAALEECERLRRTLRAFGVDATIGQDQAGETP